MYKARKEGIEETSSNYLNMPYLGAAVVKDIAVKEVGTSPNNFVVTFDLLGQDINGTDVKGVEHDRIEWSPNQDTAEDKEQGKIDRIGYFAGKFVPEEEVLAVEGQNWRDYCSKMLQLLQRHEVVGKECNIKVVGNVYKNKARVQTPMYPGWIYTDGTMPSFSTKELEANREYIAALSAKPDQASADGVTADQIDEAGF